MELAAMLRLSAMAISTVAPLFRESQWKPRTLFPVILWWVSRLL